MMDTEAFSTLSSFQVKVLEHLHAQGVRYLIFGGYAVRVHGHLRQTDDLDILVDRSPANLSKLEKALQPLIDNDQRLAEAAVFLEQPRKKVPFPSPVDPQVEFMSSIEGLNEQLLFDSVIQVQAITSGLPVPIISREFLLEAKRLAIADSERQQRLSVDRNDLEALCDR